MSRLGVLGASTAVLAVAFVACGGSGSHSGSPAVTSTAGAGGGGELAGSGGALVGGGTALAGSAGHATAGSGGYAAGESAGGSAAGGSRAIGGSSNLGGMAGAAGAQTYGGSAWIVPTTPGDGWNGPQDPACPAVAVTTADACTSPPGTRCSYPEDDPRYTLRCQCYTSSTGAGRWWCDHHVSFGFDLCPAAYPGNGGCPNIGDVTCFYVDDQDKLKACNCQIGTVQCFNWGL